MSDYSNSQVCVEHPEKAETFRSVWLALIFGGFAVRLWLWWISAGSNDADTWFQFGGSIAGDGLNATYQKLQFFNHPPLMGLFALKAYKWSHGEFIPFVRILKLAGLVGEVVTLWALWRYSSPRSAAVYAWLPAAILISGYHCNTDCLYAALVLTAVIAFDRKCHFIAGLLLGAALNVKLIPLMLLPLVFIGAPNWKALVRLIGGLAIGAVPFVFPAIDVAEEMYRNMLQYNSNADNWGIPLLLKYCARIPGFGESGGEIRENYLIVGRYVTLAAITGVAILSRFWRSRPMAEQAALGAALFLLLTPGFGVQYVVFAAPLLCMVDLTAGIRWGCSSGLFIGLVYWHFRTPGPHLASQQTSDFPMHAWIVGVVAWVILLHFVWRHRPWGGVGGAREAT